nr:MAG: protein of unknown function DUF2313 [Bacteriophage sp.]
MDAIWRAAGGKLDEIEAGVDAAANDTFISMMDAAALSDMEAFLDIAPNKNRTLEVRRKLVASYFVGANHIGAPEIKELVRGYTGDTPEVKFSKGRIYVCISPPDESAFFSSDIIECLLRKIPAHLALSLSLSYKPDVQPAYAAAAPLGTTISCTVRLPGTIKPRAVGATAYTAGAAASARMMAEVKLPGIIAPKSVSAQAYAAGRLAHTHETVTITIGGQTT